MTLPIGWTIELLRARACCNVEVLSCDRRVTLHEGEGTCELTPTCILSFSGQCLVQTEGEPDWYMGQLTDDGSIGCWGGHGTDLGKAIDGL